MCRIAGEGERLVCRERLVYKQALNGFGFACHAFIPYHIIIGTRDIIGQSDKRKFEMTHSPPETERPADAAAKLGGAFCAGAFATLCGTGSVRSANRRLVAFLAMPLGVALAAARKTSTRRSISSACFWWALL